MKSTSERDLVFVRPGARAEELAGTLERVAMQGETAAWRSWAKAAMARARAE